VDAIFQVFVIFLAATIASELVRPLRQPAIVAEIAAGAILGPHALGWIHIDQATSILASLGIVILMFAVGLELRVSDVRTVGVAAFGASIAGVVVTSSVAFGVLAAFGQPPSAGLRAGVALSATSAGIGARMLADLKRVRSRAGRVVLGAAVVDDVVVLLALSLVLTQGTSQSRASIVASAVSAIAFVALVASIGPWLARRHGRLLGSPLLRQPPSVFALAMCLGLAALSERVGLAALVGAFLAGMTFAETRDEIQLESAMQPLYEFLVPFFFVISGARVDLGALQDAGVGLPIALIMTTILAKLAGAGLGAFGLSRRERFFVGAAMIPRGEVTLAAAATALASGAITRSLYATLVSTVFVTTIVAPLVLRPAARPTTDEGPP
jgi:Kef-type K+ transport system membrane component KefB